MKLALPLIAAPVCMVAALAFAEPIELGRADGMGLGCDQRADLATLSEAIAAENFESVLDLVEVRRVCVAIWDGSKGELIKKSDDGTTAFVRVTYFAKVADWPERDLWVATDTIN